LAWRLGLFYVDAYVPSDGESLWSLTTNNDRVRFIAGVAADGLNCAPRPSRQPMPAAFYRHFSAGDQPDRQLAQYP